MKNDSEKPYRYYDDLYGEYEYYNTCSQCGRNYNEIDRDYKICSKCGWDQNNCKWVSVREPDDEDFMNGEADILTGRWW